MVDRKVNAITCYGESYPRLGQFSVAEWVLVQCWGLSVRLQEAKKIHGNGGSPLRGASRFRKAGTNSFYEERAISLPVPHLFATWAWSQWQWWSLPGVLLFPVTWLVAAEAEIGPQCRGALFLPFA